MRTFEEIRKLRDAEDSTAYDKALKEDFDEMAKVVEEFMQKYCNPMSSIIATLDGIDFMQSEVAKGFTIVD